MHAVNSLSFDVFRAKVDQSEWAAARAARLRNPTAPAGGAAVAARGAAVRRGLNVGIA